MIGRPLERARSLIDRARNALAEKCRRKQNLVDAQPPAALKCRQPVVPPGELFFRLLEEPEGIDESAGQHLPESGALGLRDMDLSQPALRIMHIAILRSDV